eukprot:2402315-Pleurochrysis_carterae.AAC.1
MRLLGLQLVMLGEQIARPVRMCSNKLQRTAHVIKSSTRLGAVLGSCRGPVVLRSRPSLLIKEGRAIAAVICAHS